MSSLEKLNILVMYGSVRPTRLGIRVVNFLRQKLEKQGHKVTIFDAMEMKFPLVEQPLHFYPDPSKAPDWLQKAHKSILAADAFLLVNGEYNRTVQPGLTNMLNHFSPKSYAYKPCAFAGYSAGPAAALLSTSHLRVHVAELNMVSVPKVFSVSAITHKLDENSQPLTDDMDTHADDMIRNLVWYATALKARRIQDGNPVPFHLD